MINSLKCIRCKQKTVIKLHGKYQCTNEHCGYSEIIEDLKGDRDKMYIDEAIKTLKEIKAKEEK